MSVVPSRRDCAGRMSRPGGRSLKILLLLPRLPLLLRETADEVEIAASADRDPHPGDEHDSVRQRFLRYVFLLAGRDRGFWTDRLRPRAQRLFCRIHTGRAALRRGHRTGW